MGKVLVIGIGPGEEKQLTFYAKEAMARCDLLCGYQVYTALVKRYFPDKNYYETPMKKEIDRCRFACEQAQGEGRLVGVLCSGDPGVYGMAGLVLELSEDFGVEVEIVPGVTAALSGAAVLGAPLMSDFCVISLSDLLTPWEIIEKRLRAAAEADFVICLYNPVSKNRPAHLERACRILKESRPAETVCGYVRCIGREGETHAVLPLSALEGEALDMFTTVFIGSSQTRELSGRMVTNRGYQV